MSDGTTAIQVSPADLAQARDMIARFALIVSEVERLQGVVSWDSGVIGDLRNDNDQLRLELQQSKDQASLLETQLAGEHSECERMRLSADAWMDDYNRVTAELAQVKRDRDDVAFKHLEVSEELASANATLDKFRSILGFPATLAKEVEASHSSATVESPVVGFGMYGAAPVPSDEPVSGPFVPPSTLTPTGDGSHAAQEEGSVPKDEPAVKKEWWETSSI